MVIANSAATPPNVITFFAISRRELRMAPAGGTIGASSKLSLLRRWRISQTALPQMNYQFLRGCLAVAMAPNLGGSSAQAMSLVVQPVVNQQLRSEFLNRQIVCS